jgi:hypothetical protein
MITVQWKMFGSSGFIAQPALVRPSFVHRALYEEPGGSGCLFLGRYTTKSIVRVSALAPGGINVHQHCCAPGWRRVDGFLEPYTAKLTEHMLATSAVLQLNHYRIQSMEFYQKVKMTRGDVWKESIHRKMSFFVGQDYKDVEDLVLAKGSVERRSEVE